MIDGKRLLITGHRGYIGSVMAPYFARHGYDVRGLDVGYFDECTLVQPESEIPSVTKDIRDLLADDVEGFDAIIHLAALSNDPIGNLNEGWTEEINHQASVRLAELALESGVQRFLFSSSCIMYGMAATQLVDETAPVDPKTEYAKSKVLAERAISELSSDHFSPTFLRNGTVYGLSPRMRFDTVMNDFVGTAYTTGRVVVFGNGTPWRPVVHVEDVARSFRAVLEAPREVVHNEIFNNGSAHLNFQVRELAEIAASVVPTCSVEILGSPGVDQRTYEADFSKFARVFPDFEFKWNPRSGALDLVDAFGRIGLTTASYEDARFTRLRWLEHLLQTGALDSSLRWNATQGATR